MITYNGSLNTAPKTLTPDHSVNEIVHLINIPSTLH